MLKRNPFDGPPRHILHGRRGACRFLNSRIMSPLVSPLLVEEHSFRGMGPCQSKLIR